MTEEYKPVSNLDTIDVLTSNDRVLVMLANGAVRTSNAVSALSNVYSMGAANTPANSTITIQAGRAFYDSGFFYVAVANNVLKRVPLQSF